MSRLIVRERAKSDIDEIAWHISLDKLDPALRFLEAAEKACQRLAEFPGMGATCSVADPRFATLRSWPIRRFENYLICYIVTAEGIDVIRVLHGARNIERIFSGD